MVMLFPHYVLISTLATIIFFSFHAQQACVFGTAEEVTNVEHIPDQKILILCHQKTGNGRKSENGEVAGNRSDRQQEKEKRETETEKRIW